MKHKRKIYLDTSVISHLYAPDVPEKMDDTKKLWDLLKQGTEFDVVVSPVVQKEIIKCNEPKRSKMIAWLEEIYYESLSEEVDVFELAEEYIRFRVLSNKQREDLLHIAYAVFARCDCIVSWNFKHFVNINTIDRVNAANLVNGYPAIKIVSPTMLIERGTYE